MKIPTGRFGEIDVDPSRVIEMPEGIPGFEHLRRYVLLTHRENHPFLWLQAVDDGGVAFVVVNPFLFQVSYEPEIPDDVVRKLSIETVEDVVVLVIVTIRKDPFRLTANLRAPVVVNGKNRRGIQVILEDHDYPIQFSLLKTPVLETKTGATRKEMAISTALGGV
jgi:flagellar assembly factor FliW